MTPHEIIAALTGRRVSAKYTADDRTFVASIDRSLTEHRGINESQLTRLQAIAHRCGVVDAEVNAAWSMGPRVVAPASAPLHLRRVGMR